MGLCETCDRYLPEAKRLASQARNLAEAEERAALEAREAGEEALAELRDHRAKRLRALNTQLGRICGQLIVHNERGVRSYLEGVAKDLPASGDIGKLRTDLVSWGKDYEKAHRPAPAGRSDPPSWYMDQQRERRSQEHEVEQKHRWKRDGPGWDISNRH